MCVIFHLLICASKIPCPLLSNLPYTRTVLLPYFPQLESIHRSAPSNAPGLTRFAPKSKFLPGKARPPSLGNTKRQRRVYSRRGFQSTGNTNIFPEAHIIGVGEKQSIFFSKSGKKRKYVTSEFFPTILVLGAQIKSHLTSDRSFGTPPQLIFVLLHLWRNCYINPSHGRSTAAATKISRKPARPSSGSTFPTAKPAPEQH